MRFDPLQASAFDSAYRQVFFCERVTIPVLPVRSSDAGSPEVLWYHSSQRISEPQSQVIGLRDPDASADVYSRTSVTRCPQPEGASARELFQSAHQLLLAGNVTSADRCLHKALGLLASQPERRSESESRLPESQPGWLVFALSALMKGELDSCETWVQQAEKQLNSGRSELSSSEFHRVSGDILAVRGCLLAQTPELLPQAFNVLLQTIDSHRTAGAWQNVALDHLLIGRLMILQRHWQAASASLRQAEGLLSKVGPLSETTCEAIRTAVRADLKRVRAAVRHLGMIAAN